MPIYKANQIHGMLREHNPELSFLLEEVVSPEDRENILSSAIVLSNLCPGIGPVSAIELLYQLGRYLHSPHAERVFSSRNSTEPGSGD